MARVLKKGQRFGTKHTNGLICYGKKEVLSSMREILLTLLDSASAATKPGPLSAVERCDGAKVSLHVTSHTRSFPSFQGTIEIPSGLLPSDLYKYNRSPQYVPGEVYGKGHYGKGSCPRVGWWNCRVIRCVCK